MARKYNGGLEVGQGFDVQSNRPLDERDIVQTQIDLLVLENCYPGIEVKVEDESYVAYKWNGIDQTNIANWVIQTTGSGTGNGDMLKSDYAFDNNTVKDSNMLDGQTSDAYMTKAQYDINDNGIVDNSEQLGGQNPSYYDQGAELTNHVDNTDVHLSTDERAAIDNTPTPPTAGNTFATQADIAASGGGDMLKANYGGTDDNTVRNSDAVGGLSSTDVDQRPHVANTNNPHATTKAHVNLGNVDNTSDAAKPISTATQTALDTKLEDVVAGANISIDKTNPLAPIISSIPQTSAGILTRVYFTGETETTTEGTFYKTKAGDGGAVASAVQQVTNGDDQKTFFAQDFIGNAATEQETLVGGDYTGRLEVEVDNASGSIEYEIEMYITDDQGAPTPSGIPGAPVGDLGVQVLAIGSTGVFTTETNTPTSVPFAFSVGSSLVVQTGVRVRYHISATKVGTLGGNVVMSLYCGSDWLAYLDAPSAVTTDGVVNTSTVDGATQTDVNNNLQTNKAGLADDNKFTGDTNTFVKDVKFRSNDDIIDIATIGEHPTEAGEMQYGSIVKVNFTALDNLGEDYNFNGSSGLILRNWNQLWYADQSTPALVDGADDKVLVSKEWVEARAALLDALNQFTAINTFQHNVNIQRGDNNQALPGQLWIGDGDGRGVTHISEPGKETVAQTNPSDVTQDWVFNNTGSISDNDVPKIARKTQAEYDAIPVKNINTFYVITDA